MALGIALALVAAGCGGHSASEDEGASATTTTAPSSSDGTGTKAGQFGTMDEAVCGPGDAKGSGDQGVSDDSIKIGTMTDAGNTIIPGLLGELVDSSQAFVKWCNAAGGINGRKIELTVHDTKLVEGQQRITEACGTDFMLVGGASGLDGPLAAPRVACGLPQIPAFTGDPAAQEAKLQVMPIFGDYAGYLPYGRVYNMAKEQLPEGIKKFAFLVGTEGTDTKPNSVKYPEALKAALGYHTVSTGATPPPPGTVDNWRPYIEPMKSGGAQVLEFQHIADYLVPFMNSFADTGFKPKMMINGPGAYSSTLIKGNDALADVPTYVESYIYPFEGAADNPPTQQFLDAMDASKPGWSKDPKALSAQSWSAWLLFAQSAKACGSDLTRNCVMDKAANAGKWDAGGLIAPGTISVGKPEGPLCTVILDATPDGFKIDEKLTKPTDGIFNCDAANRIPTS
ncbi:ABC transporter substrate-binding protein [Aquihabitans sp. McL0605]|uniref:ABC transporter substrate-binding protein n=1 Tax=Aquihabitans sp. McL0605 TaxID=3415671 RepID=UPI003CF29C39